MVQEGVATLQTRRMPLRPRTRPRQSPPRCFGCARLLQLSFAAYCHEILSTALGGDLARLADLLNRRHVLDEVDQGIGERLDIVRLAAGDDLAIRDRSLIDDVATGIPEVGADRGPTRHRSSA